MIDSESYRARISTFNQMHSLVNKVLRKEYQKLVNH